MVRMISRSNTKPLGGRPSSAKYFTEVLERRRFPLPLIVQHGNAQSFERCASLHLWCIWQYQYAFGRSGLCRTMKHQLADSLINTRGGRISFRFKQRRHLEVWREYVKVARPVVGDAQTQFSEISGKC